MWTMLALLVQLTFGYWVVKGYAMPPVLVAGPYATWADCQRMAAEINRIQLSFEYHCEMH